MYTLYVTSSWICLRPSHLRNDWTMDMFASRLSAIFSDMHDCSRPFRLFCVVVMRLSAVGGCRLEILLVLDVGWSKVPGVPRCFAMALEFESARGLPSAPTAADAPRPGNSPPAT